MREPRPAASAQLLVSLLLVLLVLPALPAVAVTVEEIPSPRPNGWSVDLTGRIARERLAEIDRVGDEVRAKSGGEIAVVVVGTTDGVPSRPFATQLFNRWKIGQAEKDNGVLLFLALDDRKAEVILGNGFANPNLREVSASILQGHMVPLLRQGDPGAAAVAGARAAAWQLFSVALTSPLPAPPGTEGISPLAAPGPNPAVRPQTVGFEEISRLLQPWGLLLLGFGVLVWGAYKAATFPPMTRPPGRYRNDRDDSGSYSSAASLFSVDSSSYSSSSSDSSSSSSGSDSGFSGGSSSGDGASASW